MEIKNEDILSMLQTDVKMMKEQIAEVCNEIIEQGYSEFPIVIAHEEEIAIADKIIDRDLFSTNFHFSASTMESMVEKGILLKERQDQLKEKIKASKDQVCILLLHPKVMRFVFAPVK